MKKFLKNFFLQNRLSDFEIISQECSLGDPFQKCSQNFDLCINMALVNGGFLHCTDMKKFLKNLVLRNCSSDFEIISQESGFDISRHPDCPDSGRNCYRQGALTICEPAEQVKFLVCYCQFWSLLQIPVVFGL